MRYYTKPCICEENPDHIILHVGANKLNSEKKNVKLLGNQLLIWRRVLLMTKER